MAAAATTMSNAKSVTEKCGVIRSDLYSAEALEDFRIRAGAPPSGKNVPSVIPVLASLLERTVARQTQKRSIVNNNSNSVEMNDRLAKFSGCRVPAISIQQYFERIFKYANCSHSCFVVAYVYLDRLLNNNKIIINERNVHRLVITSVLVAAKFLDDLHYDNAYFAQIGGISTQEMNKLEMDFLYLLGFRLQVSQAIFDSYCDHLEREATLGGLQRTLDSISHQRTPLKEIHNNIGNQPKETMSQNNRSSSAKSMALDRKSLSRSTSRIVRCGDGS